MSAKVDLSTQIRAKAEKLLEAKRKYNNLVRSVDEEFADKMKQLSEQCVHVPLSLANQITEALTKGKTKTKEFKNYVQQLSDVLNYIESDFSNSSEQDLSYHQSLNSDENIQQNTNHEINMNSDSNQSFNLNESNNSNTSNHAADELTLSSNNSDDILNHLNSMQLDMNQYINQNYENQEDFDAINGMS